MDIDEGDGGAEAGVLGAKAFGIAGRHEGIVAAAEKEDGDSVEGGGWGGDFRDKHRTDEDGAGEGAGVEEEKALGSVGTVGVAEGSDVFGIEAARPDLLVEKLSEIV